MHSRAFFPSSRSSALAALTVAAALLCGAVHAQQPTTTTQPGATTQVGDTTVTGSSQTATNAQGKVSEGASISFSPNKKKKAGKDDKVVQSKDTRAENKKAVKLDPLAGKDATLPDKALYDKALDQTKRGHYDVARLDLQTLLNTYPDSQYEMRAKLAIADSWYKEGGSAALAQAEQEYVDFITFFPNVPEAAEAQMRVGDIYFKQMDVPDRDYSKSVKAQEAYRLMLKQYPESTLIPEATQKLREVQEVMATREAYVGALYVSHNNWAAAIARYQTVVDSYPQYSHMDDVLIGIGDAFAATARNTRLQPVCAPTLPAGTPCLTEAAKASILQAMDGKAADAYRKVVLEHSAAPHVEDAKERLESMGLPIPTPTPEQARASEALENSRQTYNLQKRLAVLLLHRPDTVLAPRIGDPPLDDVAVTTAPAVSKDMQNIYLAAFNPAGAAATAPAKPAEAAPAADPNIPAPPPPSNAPLALQDVAAPGEGSAGSGTSTMTAAPAEAARPAGASLGMEVLTPGVTSTPNVNTKPNPATGLRAVGPANATALPPVEAPAEAPDQINDAAGKPQPAAQTVQPGQKAAKPGYDKQDESSSKHKQKKGIDKINPL